MIRNSRALYEVALNHNPKVMFQLPSKLRIKLQLGNWRISVSCTRTEWRVSRMAANRCHLLMSVKVNWCCSEHKEMLSVGLRHVAKPPVLSQP